VRRLQEALRLLVGGGRDLHAVLRAAGLVFSIRVVASLINYALIVILARWMGAAEFGIYAYALSWCLLLTVPSGLGVPGMCLRYLGQYKAAMDFARLRGLLIRSVETVAASGATVALIGIAAFVLGRSGSFDGRALAVSLAVAGIPVMAFSVLASQIGRGLGWMATAYAPTQIGQAVVALSVAATFVSCGHTLTAPLMVAVALSAFALAVAVQAGVYAHRLRPVLRGVQPVFETKAWLRVALPLVLFEGFAGIVAQSDTIMVGLFLQPHDIGHYQAAVRTAMLATFVPQAVTSLAAPKIAGIHGRGSTEQLQAFVSSVVPWIVLPTFALSLSLILLAGPLLALFGGGFAGGLPALVLLVAGYFVSVCFGPAPLILNMTGHQDDCARVFATTAFANVALNFVLIPRLGITGAAAASSLALAFSNGILAWIVRKRLGVSPWITATPHRPPLTPPPVT